LQWFSLLKIGTEIIFRFLEAMGYPLPPAAASTGQFDVKVGWKFVISLHSSSVLWTELLDTQIWPHLWLCCAEGPASHYLWPLASRRHYCCGVSVPRAVVGFIDRHAPCWGVTMATSECFLPSGNHHPSLAQYTNTLIPLPPSNPRRQFIQPTPDLHPQTPKYNESPGGCHMYSVRSTLNGSVRLSLPPLQTYSAIYRWLKATQCGQWPNRTWVE